MQTSTKTFALIGLLALGGIAPAYAGQSINARQLNQDLRVEQGVRSGELTRAEARYLEVRQAQVAQLEQRLRHNGLNPYERQRLKNELGQLSDEIYRLKHNRFDRPRSDVRRVSWHYGDRGHDAWCERGHDRSW